MRPKKKKGNGRRDFNKANRSMRNNNRPNDQSDRFTRMESVTVKSARRKPKNSQKRKKQQQEMNPNNFSGMLADESFDLDVNVEEIDDEDYRQFNDNSILKKPFI